MKASYIICNITKICANYLELIIFLLIVVYGIGSFIKQLYRKIPQI